MSKANESLYATIGYLESKGLKPAEIAEICKCSRATVYRHRNKATKDAAALSRIKWTPEKRAELFNYICDNPSLYIKEVAEHFGYTKKMIYSTINRFRSEYEEIKNSKLEIHQIKKIYLETANGKSATQISYEMGISKSDVEMVLTDQNIKRRLKALYCVRYSKLNNGDAFMLIDEFPNTNIYIKYSDECFINFVKGKPYKLASDLTSNVLKVNLTVDINF